MRYVDAIRTITLALVVAISYCGRPALAQSAEGKGEVTVNQEILKEYADVFDLYKDFRKFDEEMRGTGEINLADYRKIMARACTRLSDLSGDKNFESLMLKLETFYKEAGDSAREVITEYEKFTRYLLPERAALLQAGLSEREVDYILGEMHKLRTEIQDSSLSAAGILKSLYELKSHTCRLTVAITEKLEWQRQLATIGNVTLGLAGIALGVVDVAAAIPLPFAVTSGLSASAMVGTAASNLFNF